MGIGSWAGLWFALGIPAILIMYLFKRKFIDTPVPSHLLWKRVLENTEANRPWQKLKSRLLMWLQLLAAALLAFALMRPFLWAENGTGGYTIVVADVSASMSANLRSGEDGGENDVSAAGTQADHSTSNETRLDQMKDEILADTRQSDGGLTLIRMGANPQVIASGMEDRASWERTVDSLSPDYARIAYREAISLASAVAEGHEDARIVVYTDGQWSERTDDLPVSVPIEVRRIESGGYRNAAVEQFGVDGSGRAVGVVSNTGTTALEVRVELSGDGQTLTGEDLTLQPGERRTVTFEAAEAANVYRLSLTGETSDDYAADDDAFAFPETGGEVKALLLSNGNLFLEKAMRLSGAEVTRMDLHTSMTNAGSARSEGLEGSNGSDTASESEDPSSDVPPLPEERPDLVVIEGELPAAMQSGEWDRLMSEATIWKIGGDEERQQPGNRRVEIVSHPVMKYLSLNEPYFGPLTEGKPDGLETILSIGQRPAIAAGMVNGQRTLWFGFNLQSGDLPLNSEFPVLVNNAVTWLSGGRGGGLGRAVSGSAIDVPIAAGAESAVWQPLQGLAFAAGSTVDAAIGSEGTSAEGTEGLPGSSQPDAKGTKGMSSFSQPAAKSSDGILSSSQITPNMPGLYAFEQSGSELEDAPVYLLDVRPDAAESAVPPAENPVFGEASGNAAGQQAVPDQAAAEDNRSRLPLTIPLAALIIAIMLTEWGVYRRGRSI
ncbi:vWA domain-containing protein [Saccharibacillus kuerlensis]|uniref:VWA domain-containing protein n=1 Tax=Saccharibacillus kuerlensis TaxID=459527 RepID=A0ABQ2L1T4_9BACL|nr:VWA domain-containing protein [Saccharibacillus kuerlensis]GGN99474.1 hypothetical protein GCM10010969_19630 [Saccharibacillus kuerlensis]